MSSVRWTLGYTSLALVLVFFLFSGVRNEVTDTWSSLVDRTPDFSKYVHLESLSSEKFPIDDEHRRVIVVGDIHGMYDRLIELLSEVSFDPSSDVLVSVGDIVAKGPHSGSMAVLDFMNSNNIIAVRGNHDQKVIEWRSWVNWIHSLRGGKEWLDHAIRQWEKAREEDGIDVEDWVAKKMKHDSLHRKWWRKIPKGWKFLGDHFKIAMEMTPAHYKYLSSLPLKIHIPHAHTFIVHAGLLASDPDYRPSNHRQPLAKAPKIPKYLLDRSSGNTTIAILRRLQEHAILNEVPQNVIPWNNLNMRGVIRKSHRVTRTKEGRPWSKLYKNDMQLCGGFDSEKSVKGKHSLPCMPSTVIYGHAASRGLDIKRYSIGLDTGCVYERRLTALVLGGKENLFSLDENDGFLDGIDNFSDDDDDNDDEESPLRKKIPSRVKFGDNGRGRIISIKC